MTARIAQFALACSIVLGGCGGTPGPSPFSAGPAPGAVASAPAGSWPAIKRGPSSRPSRDLAEAPAELPEAPQLSDYLAYAALNNPGLRAAFHRWQAALEKVPQVQALPEPRFTYRYFIEEVETRVGPQRNSFELAQTLPWFGKLSVAGSAAAEAANAARQEYETARLGLFHYVKNAYCEYYYLGWAVAVTKENIELLKQVEAVARARYRAAEGPHADLVRLQVELGKLSDRLASLQDLREPIVARLNAALNRPPSAPVGPYPAAVEGEKVHFTDEQLLGWLAEANPELKGMDAEIERQKRFVELARKGYFPDFTFGLGWIDTDRSIGGRHPDEDGKDPIIAMVSVNLPIWWDKLAAAVREARHSLTAAAQRKSQRANSLAAETKLAAFGFRDAGRKVNLYRDTLLPKAQEAFKVTQTAYQAGTASFADLIDTLRILLDFELSVHRALADRGQRLAELEMLVGRRLTGQDGQGRED